MSLFSQLPLNLHVDTLCNYLPPSLFKINYIYMIVFLNKCFSPKASYGYGGKFGVQKDRMDQV